MLRARMPKRIPSVEEATHMLARLDEVEIDPADRAVLKQMIEQFLTAMALLGKQDTTLEELRSRLFQI
jgi:hypothetical protein